MGKVTVTNGCYIDGANQRNNIEIITKMIDLLESWNPYHKILTEKYSVNVLNEFSSEIIDELTQAIQESIDSTQSAEWVDGDFIINSIEG